MASTGSIIFNVFTSDARIPLEGATVLLRRQDAPREILGIRITNASGQTDPIMVLTKDVSLGQTPESTVKPWVGCAAIIEHPDYERVFLDGIQIFPGIVTLQTVQMVPLRELDPNLDGEQELKFTPQPIWEEQTYD